VNDRLHDEIANTAAGEAARLDELVELLESALARAQAEAAQLIGLSQEQIAILRAGLRQDRFGDVAGIGEELANARAEFAMVQELRRRLAHGR
jgi:hypothetical protein